jgi:DNA polymerase-3 subunit gamma/tau
MIFKVTGNFSTFKSEEIDLNKINLDDILNALNILQESYKNMNGGANKKLEAEIAVIKLCNGFKSYSDVPKSPEKAAPEKKAELKKTPDKSAAPEKTETQKIETVQPKVQEVLLNSNEETLPQGTNPLEHWTQILEALKNTKSLKSLYISLRDSSAYERGNHILIDSSNSLAFELLRRDEYRIAIKKLIKDVTGKQYNLGPYTAENENHKEPTKPDPFDKLIKNANSSGIDVKFI